MTQIPKIGPDPDRDIKNAIMKMEDLANRVAQRLEGRTFIEILAFIAYMLLLAERALRENGKFMLREQSFAIVTTIANIITTIQAKGSKQGAEAAMPPSDTKN
jgi:hypothetical protein